MSNLEVNEMVMLPPLSQRLRTILKTMAANESHITMRFPVGTPGILRESGNLVEKTLIKIMEEIEKGPGSTRLW